MKAKSINQIKYASIIEFLDAYVNNIQNDYERFKERNGPTKEIRSSMKKYKGMYFSLIQKMVK